MDMKLNDTNLEALEKFINVFLRQKINLESKIRTFEATSMDICKEILLEEYFSGIIIMLNILKIKYTIADRQQEINIDIEKYMIDKTVDEKIANFLADLKKITMQKYEIYKKMSDTNDEKDAQAVEVMSLFYCLIGALTAANKLNIDFNIKGICYLKENGQEVTDNEFTYNIKNEASLDSEDDISDEEIESYKVMSEKINEMADSFFKKINDEKNIKSSSWQNDLFQKHDQLLEMSTESYSKEEYDYNKTFLKRQIDIGNETIEKIQNEMNDYMEDCKTLMESFMQNYYI